MDAAAPQETEANASPVIWTTPREFARFCTEHEDDPARYELLNGRIVMNPPPSWNHADGNGEIYLVLRSYVDPRNLGKVLIEVGVQLPSGDVVGPDIVFISRKAWSNRAARGATWLRIVPTLAVEVLSASTQSRDRGEKKAIYERNGVREYWLVDREHENITRFVLRQGRYGSPTVFGANDAFRSVVLKGLRFPVSRVLRDP